jgi:hypothetical protein
MCSSNEGANTAASPAASQPSDGHAACAQPCSAPRRILNVLATNLAAEDIGGSLLAVIQFPAWSRIRAAGLEHALLVAAEKGGLTAVNGLIAQVTGSPALPMPETRPACPGPGVR